MTDVWTKWESLVINGVFPLRRFLSRSNHSVVFLTEHRAKNVPDAAIKLVPADPVRGEAQLACWRMDASLSHPHLIRLFDVGRCQLGGHNFIFVVMEFADQTLAQLLSHRALTAGEVREMLPPTLDALSFLHRKRLVQGQLKPPNILVVNDQLKLASDTIRPAGASTVSVAESSLYDPPEAKDGRMFGAGDVWALGVTLIEALTQQTPSWPDESSDTVCLPATLAPEYADTLRRCLNLNPANRPTIADLEAQFKQPTAFPAPAAEPVRANPAAQPTPAAQPNPALEPDPGVQSRGAVQSQLALQPAQSSPSAQPKPTASPQPSAQPKRAAPPQSTVQPGPTVQPQPTARPKSAVPSKRVAEISLFVRRTMHGLSTSLARTAAVVRAKAIAWAQVISRAGAAAPGWVGRAPLAHWVIRARLPIAAVAGGLILLSAVWAGIRLFHGPAAPTQAAAAPPSQHIVLPVPAATPAAAPSVAAQIPPASAPSPLTVVHQEIPEASRGARESIRGRISVTIRVVVDRSGNVTHESVEYSGSSRYFARLASDAARKWRFAPVDTQEPRVWLLRFEFTRSGTTGHAAPHS